MRKFIIFILLLGFHNLVFAETVTLKSGKIIEGKILEKNDQYIKIDVAGSPIYYERKYISSIDESDASVLKDAKFYFKEALRLASESKLNEAESALKKGLEINSSDYNLQELSRMINNLKAGSINEKYAHYLFSGSHYLINNRYDEAIKEFQAGLSINPNDPDLYYYLGIAYFSLDKHQEAIDYFKKVLTIQPNNDEVYYYVGISQYFLGQYQEAISNLEKSVELNPNDAESYSILGMSNYALGRLSEAKEALVKARDLFKNKGDYLKSADIDDFLNKIS
ncbi:MAG: hypothetical protein A2984_02210 [Omnitrophica WOR_2 bacterium RIFCSPLOWO2_01_FULL_41_12]|nr:MAG: hypothetical protein A2984_02210 [Omnitrophica WOR_2 bacterium RIFCSPLOWO2_01_FULL_41_12]